MKDIKELWVAWLIMLFVFSFSFYFFLLDIIFNLIFNWFTLAMFLAFVVSLISYGILVGYIDVKSKKVSL